MIALDSSVLLDILIGDPVYGEVSEICIGDAWRATRSWFATPWWPKCWPCSTPRST